jgi:signal transduction histidine kinase
MLKLSVPRGLWFPLLMVIVPFLALIALQTYEWLERFPRLARDRESVARAFQVITAAQLLKASLQDAERGERGYLLTGGAAYLEPYRSSELEIPRLLASLERLTARNAEQRRRVMFLAQQVAIKRREMSRGLEVYEREGLEAAQSVLRTNTGLEAMRSLGRVIDATVSSEEGLLSGRLASAGDDERSAARLALAGGVLTCLIMILGVALTLFAFHEARRVETERLVNERRLGEELARSRAALAQSQKMEAIGQLTGGIAHDFNNLLHVIRNAIEIVQRRLKDEDLRRYLEMAQRNTDRAASTTARLLAFARRQPLEPRPVNANALVSGMADLLHHTIGEGVAMRCVLAGDLWIASVDANQLETAILNLAVNARDAMSGEGRLTIETANVFLEESDVESQQDVAPGQYVMIGVGDSGSGMTKEVMARAFEPFFTTKRVGEGTGLGLSQVFGFVKQSGGHVKICSELGVGTIVRLYFPRGGTALEAQPAVAGDRPGQGAHGETILIVEDDEDVRAFTAQVLGELGYRVAVAPDAHLALAVLEKLSGVQLLFTDVRLPNGLSGRDLADTARRRWPNIKILFATGYAGDPIVHHGRVDPGVELILKPFTQTSLARKVRRVLDGDHPAAS